MQKISNKYSLSVLFTLLILLLIAKAIGVLFFWYLPSSGIEVLDRKSYGVTYQRIDFKNVLIKIQESKDIQEEKSLKENSVAFSIDSLLLKGLYGNDSFGYAILAEKASPKETEIVAVGEVFQGYELNKIELSHVIFRKNSKSYILQLESTEAKESQKVNRVMRVKKRDIHETEKRVTRADINSYASNPSKIWKDISIRPLKRNGVISGFQVTRIKKGSKMAELGLEKGDVIIEANNIRLSSFKDAIKLYKNINKLDTISLIVERNHEEKEIIYEIR